jgi:ABC-type Na+ efflux pump permease subunit
MNNILLIAIREFRQIAAMRSFWFTLLILPFAFAIGPLTQKLLNGDDIERVMIVDRTGGGEAQSIAARLSVDYDRQILSDLSRYVQRHHLEAADPQAVWAQHDRWYGPADVAAFRASGGLPAAQAKIERVAPKDVPKFDAPKRAYQIADTPPELAAVPDSALDTKLQDYLNPKAREAEPVDEVLLVPATFGQSPVVRLWARSRPDPNLVTTLQDVLTRDLRVRTLQAQGTSPDVAQKVNDVTTTIAVSTPPPGGGAREAMLVKSILPLFASYLLMMSLMLSGSWALQGTVEERSNKLLETVLACVSPRQLMYGKLLGTVAIGLSMVAVWVACGAVAAFATHGAIADLIRPALAPLTSPLTIAAMIYFFVAGYAAISIIFLAIGAMSDTMREAQGYLMPVMLAILLPITLLIQAILAGGKGVAIEVLTWVPIWTPFAVLARLGAGIPTWEVLATGVLLGLFAAVEVVLLGRLFRASLLAQGQRPNLREIASRMRSTD